MSTTNVTICMDEELKKQAEDLFSDLGFNLTTAFIVFVKQAIREQRMPFVMSRNIPNEETRKAIEGVRNGYGISKSFSSISDLMDDLNAED